MAERKRNKEIHFYVTEEELPLLVKVRRTGKMQKNLTGSIGNKNVVRLWTGYQKNQELNGL